MMDSVTDIEQAMDKKKSALHRHKMEINKINNKLPRMDKNDTNYVRRIDHITDKIILLRRICPLITCPHHKKGSCQLMLKGNAFTVKSLRVW